MAKFPKKPRVGLKTMAALYRSINEIIDYLPSLTVKGDGRSTKVSNTKQGSIISVKAEKNNNLNYQGDYPLFFFGDGISSEYNEEMISGLQGVSKELLPQYVGLNIVGDNQYISAYYPTSNSGTIDLPIVISYIGPTPSGGGGGSGTTYTSGRFITISGTNNSINCTLSTLYELYNNPIISDTRPLSSEIANTYVYPSHYMQLRDWIGNRGINTVVTSGSFRNTHTGAGDPGSWEYIFQYTGPQVDCLLTGGRFVKVNSHWQDSGGETPLLQEPDDHTINNLLSGDADVYPNTSGHYIFIKELTGVNEINADGSWGGIISTNLHGDGTSVTIDNDGTIHATGGGGNLPSPVTPNTVLSADNSGTPCWSTNTGGSGGGGSGCAWPKWENLCGSGNIVLTQTWYTTSNGGWLRISNKGGGTVSGCNSVYIDPVVPPIVDGVHAMGQNHIGLGVGIMTYTLAVPPGSSFYIEFPSGTEACRCWFDGNTSPAKTNATLIEGRDKIIRASSAAVEKAGQTRNAYENALNFAINYLKDNYLSNIEDDYLDSPEYYRGWYFEVYNSKSTATERANEAAAAALSCQNAYNTYTAAGGTIDQSYVTIAVAASGEALAYVTSAQNMLLTAGYYYDLEYNHYKTCPNHSGWFAQYEEDYGEPFEKYDNPYD